MPANRGLLVGIGQISLLIAAIYACSVPSAPTASSRAAPGADFSISPTAADTSSRIADTSATRTPASSCYDVSATATGLRPDVVEYLRSSPFVVIGTVKRNDGAQWSSPDGSRPAGPPVWPDGIFRRVQVGDLETLRGTIGRPEITVRLAGGQIGCTRVNPVIWVDTPSEGRRYVLLLWRGDGDAMWALAAWEVTGDSVHAMYGLVSVARFREIVAADACDRVIQCDDAILD